MSIKNIIFENFRNLQDGKIDIDNDLVFIIGQNGQGKTNFLEGIYFLTIGSSFRTRNDNYLVKEGYDYFSISGNTGVEEVGNINIYFSVNGKKIKINMKNINDRKQLLGRIPSIAFSHEDFKFVDGTNENKRWFIDQSICLTQILYLDEYRKYKKILKTRNTILKDNKYNLLDSLDYQLCLSGIELMKYRFTIIKYFSDIIEKIFYDIMGVSEVRLKYKPSWNEYDFQKIMQYIKTIRDKEYLYQITMSGPHRDRYEFYMRNNKFVEKASTGQKRLLSLILRVAQAKNIYEHAGIKPILIFDDVLLELDQKKRMYFLEILPPYQQAFFSFLPEEPIDKYAKGKGLILKIKNGKIIQ